MSQSSINKRPRWQWVIGFFAFSFFVSLCTLIGFYVVQFSPAFYTVPPTRSTISWTTLPTPRLVHPQWTSYTSFDSVRDVLLTGDLRWIATDGGLVVQDIRSDQSVQFATEHGLPSNLLTSMALGQDGRVWVGSQAGVGVYDGRDWVTYRQASSGLPSDRVNDLLVSRDGVVWAGTARGLARFDGESWSQVRFSLLDFSPIEIRHLLLARDGRVWVATDRGIRRFDGQNWEEITVADGLLNDDVRQLAATPDGSVWAATKGGIALFNGRTWERFTVRQGLQDLPVFHIAAAADNSIYLAYDQSPELGAVGVIERFDRLAPAGVSWGDGDAVNQLTTISGNVWIGANSGFWEQGDSGWQQIALPEAFPSAIAYDLLEADDALWVSGSAGVSRWGNNRWETWDLGDVRALSEDNGRVFAALGTPADGVRIFADSLDEWQMLDCATAGPTLDTILAGALDTHGRVWYMGLDGVAAYDPVTLSWTHFRNGWPTNEPEPRALAIDRDGNVWAGLTQGLFRLDEARNLWILEEGDAIRRLAPSPSGGLWVVTSNALLHRVDGQMSPVQLPPNTEFTSGFAATDDALWVSTADGVARLQDGEWRTFGLSDGLASDDVTVLTVADDGTLWLGYASALFGFSYFDETEERWQIVHNVVDPDAPNNGHAGSNLPRRDEVRSLDVSANGQVWYGTRFGEVGRVAADELLYRPDDYRLYWSAVQSVLAHPDGSVWIAGWQGRIARYLPEDGSWLRYQESLATAVVQDVVTNSGEVWLGTDKGVVQFSGEICEMLPFRDSDLSVMGGTVDPDTGNIWWGTANQGAVLYDADEQNFTWPALHLRGRRIQAVGQSASSEVWFADEISLYNVADNGRETITVGRELVGAEGITALVIDRNGRPWVGTSYGALTPAGGDWQSLTTADGLSSNHVSAIYILGDGVMWFVTDGGLSRYIP